jgi:hypothetical protein
MKLNIRGRSRAAYLKPVLITLGLSAAIALLNGLTVSAATSSLPTSGAASGLSISPLRQDLTLKPGQADKIDITLKNITGGPIIAQVGVRDFESDNVTGNPKIITNTSYKDPASISNFLIGLGNVPLAIGEQKTFSIPVQAPSNAVPGAYYGLVTYQAVPQSSAGAAGNNKVALSAAVSQLVFITVPGNVNQRLQLNAIHVYRQKTVSGEGVFFTKPPQSIGVELHNYGNGFATPFGTVIIKNSEGKQVYSYELNGGITRGLMLPNSSRIFVNPLKNIKHPGRYTVTVNASYGSGSDILTGKKTFWYIQSWLLIAIVVIIILLILAVVAVRLRYKRVTTRRYRR